MTANEGASVLCVQYGPACVELKFADGSMISIDCTAVEDEVAKNMYQRSELDYLIYNKSLEYAQIALGGVGEVYPSKSLGLKNLSSNASRIPETTSGLS